MVHWPYPVIDFLSTTENGTSGRWRDGLVNKPWWDDGSHPNVNGYRAMYDAVDVGLFKL